MEAGAGGGKEKGEEERTVLAEDTLETLFLLGILAEINGEMLYQGLAEQFSHLPVFAEYWKKMMVAEKRQGQLLFELKRSLPKEDLARPANLLMLSKAREIQKTLVELRNASVQSLEGAFRIAHAYEEADVHALFSYLVNMAVPEERWLEIISVQLKEHLLNLQGLNKELEREKWEGILAKMLQ